MKQAEVNVVSNMSLIDYNDNYTCTCVHTVHDLYM